MFSTKTTFDMFLFNWRAERRECVCRLALNLFFLFYSFRWKSSRKCQWRIRDDKYATRGCFSGSIACVNMREFVLIHISSFFHFDLCNRNLVKYFPISRLICFYLHTSKTCVWLIYFDLNEILSINSRHDLSVRIQSLNYRVDTGYMETLWKSIFMLDERKERDSNRQFEVEI